MTDLRWTPPAMEGPDDTVSPGRLLGAAARVALLCIAIYLAGTQPFGFSVDRRNYEILYNISAVEPWRDILTSGDAGYFGLSKIFAGLGLSFDLFAFCLSAMTCLILAATVRNIKTQKWVLYAVYGSYLFWLHEYTQIRVAMGLAFFLYAVYAATPWRWLCFVPAILFHNSLIMIVAIFIGLRINGIFYRVAIAAVAAFLLFGPFSTFFTSLIGRILTYQDLSQTAQFSQINLFSLMPICQAVYLVCAAFWFTRFTDTERTEWIISCVGIACFYLLSPIPVLAFRTYEMMMPFFVILSSRMWDRSILFKIAIIPYVLLGLRSSFFSTDSLVIF